MTRRSCLAAVMACVCLSTSISFGEQYYRYAPKPVTAEENQAAGDGVLVKEIPIQKGDTLYDLSRKFNGKGFYYPQILLFNDIKDPNKIYTGDLIKIPLGESALKTGKPAGTINKDSRGKHGSKTANNKKRKQRLPSSAQPTSTSKQDDTVELSVKDLQRLDATHGTTPATGKRISHRDRKTSKTAVKKPVVLTPAPAPVAENLPEQTLQPDQEKTAAVSSAAQKTFERALKAFRQENCSVALELFERFIAENPTSPLAADANLYKAECYLKQSGL